MAQAGTVKFFSFSKGFGFITPNEGGEDVFVHATGVAGNPLKEGDQVSYELDFNQQKQKYQALNVQGGSGYPMDPSKGKGKGGGFGGGGFGGGFGGGYGGGGYGGGGYQQDGGFGGQSW